MRFDLTLHAPDTVLHLSLGTSERIVDRIENVGMTFVRVPRAPDRDLASARENQMNVDFIDAAGPMALTRCPHGDMTFDQAAEFLLEGVDMLGNESL